MADGSIRVRSESEYVIEVNDKGETISFDLLDNNLVLRAMEAFKQIDELFKEYEGREAELDNQEEEVYLDGEITIPKGFKTGCELMDEVYTKARAAMDLFLGEGACQKIFGDKNTPDMFEVLTEELSPHLEKMGINAQRIKTKALQKHGPNRAQRRAMK